MTNPTKPACLTKPVDQMTDADWEAYGQLTEEEIEAFEADEEDFEAQAILAEDELTEEEFIAKVKEAAHKDAKDYLGYWLESGEWLDYLRKQLNYYNAGDVNCSPESVARLLSDSILKC